MTDWQEVGVVPEGFPIRINGVNPWNFDWRASNEEAVELPHPSHPSQLHRMEIYEIEDRGRTIKFAAGELSMNVWGFYVPLRKS